MMTGDRRNAAPNPTSLSGLLLIGAVMCGWCPALVGGGTAAVSNSPTSCSGVVCPKDKCPSHLTYLHPCCGDKPMCSCFDEQNRIFRPLKSIWLSNDCRSKCQCVKDLDPVTYRYKLMTKCQPLRCPASKANCQKGLEKCCSVCKVQPSGCFSPELGRNFKNLETWRPSVCRQCTCLNENAVCTRVECAHLSCPPGLTPQTLPKECCPSYCRNSTRPILPYHSCRDHSRNISYSHLSSYRPQWPCSPLTCVCRHGDWECDNRTAACPTTCAKNRSISLGRPGQCCPMCFGTRACLYGSGEYHFAGHIWFLPDKQLQCACIHGMVECMSVPMSLSTTKHPPPALGPASALPTWIPILLVVLALLVFVFVIATVFALRGRCDSRFCALFHVSLGCWPRATGSRSGSDKTALSMHYKKGAETEVMIAADIDENANQRTTEALA